ncbi:MAG: WXG100 family type VII secretion target [Synergistaceae bacterium]|jgi:cell wall-associated NlpC family hydrolase|nr:WXG100 family type VII secretion target [Synergistaceae bacterium]
MDTYRVLADGMMKKSANVGNTAESMLSSQQAITKLVNSLTKDDFNGQLPEMMKQKVVGLEEKYNRMHETLTNYSKAITAAANTYVATDQAIARWADELGVDETAIRGGGTVAVTPGSGEGVLDSARNYIEKYNPRPGEECKGFVRHVFNEKYGAQVPSTVNGNLEWADDGGNDFNEVSRLRIAGSPSTEQLKDFLQNMAPGDAVQINWKYGPHTMIIDSIQRDSAGNITGVSVIDANYGLNNVVHERSYTLEKFAGEFGGSNQGMTAYRYAGA